MRIFTALTYYSPHISGLTVYARRLAGHLVEQGHDVTVLTSHYDQNLPRREVIDGATVVRSPVALRMNKGALMPVFVAQAAKFAATHDIVHVHLPQFEASAVALAARLTGKPVVATYHCDIQLPPGPGRLAYTPLIRASHYLTGKLAQRIIVNSQSYAETGRLTRRFLHKVKAVYPPVELAASDPTAAAALATRIGTARRPIVGFVGRFAEEKGIEYLIDAVPRVLAALPNAHFVLAGGTEQIPGENVFDRVRPRIADLNGSLTHVGLLSDAELRAFYELIDVLVLPSINATESFGMTQAEAMLAGTPVVATNLPGVREPIDVTGLGLLVPPRDSARLADGIVEVLRHRERYAAGRLAAAAAFSGARTAAFYNQLFLDLAGEAPVGASAGIASAGAPKE
jgi:glycosyltransferase involved in cell wall biosynthesis